MILHGKNGPFSFKAKLTRRGAAYTGQAATHFGCGSPGSSIPYPVTLKIKIHPTKAIGENVAWAATSVSRITTHPNEPSAAHTVNNKPGLRVDDYRALIEHVFQAHIRNGGRSRH